MVVAPFGRIIRIIKEAPYLANAVVLYNFLGRRLIPSCVRDDSLLMSSRRPVLIRKRATNFLYRDPSLSLRMTLSGGKVQRPADSHTRPLSEANTTFSPGGSAGLSHLHAVRRGPLQEFGFLPPISPMPKKGRHRSACPFHQRKV